MTMAFSKEEGVAAAPIEQGSRQCPGDPVAEAQLALWDAISEFGHNSAEAMVARIFVGEVKRRVACEAVVANSSSDP